MKYASSEYGLHLDTCVYNYRVSKNQQVGVNEHYGIRISFSERVKSSFCPERKLYALPRDRYVCTIHAERSCSAQRYTIDS